MQGNQEKYQYLVDHLGAHGKNDDRFSTRSMNFTGFFFFSEKVATMDGSNGTCGGNRRRFLKTAAALGAAVASADRLVAAEKKRVE